MAHLTQAQVAHFEEQGYLVVEDLFDPEQDLHPVIEEYGGVLDRLAQDLYLNFARISGISSHPPKSV